MYVYIGSLGSSLIIFSLFIVSFLGQKWMSISTEINNGYRYINLILM